MIREHDGEGSIVLVSEENRLPYDRPPLSKEVIRGEMAPEEIKSEYDVYYRDYRVTTRLGVKVTALRLGERSHEAQLSTGETLGFRRALLATGGVPRRLGIPGEDLPGVYVLRNDTDAVAIAEEARALRDAGQDRPQVGEERRAVIIGAGFIGVELAASLRQLGVPVTVVEMAEDLWPSFAPPELAEPIRRRCEAEGVEFRFGRKVTALESAGAGAGTSGHAAAGGSSAHAGDGAERVGTVVLDNGERLSAGMVCVAVGIEPSVELARDAGLTVADGVVVNEHLQSSHPDVFAAGDLIRFPDPFTGTRRRVEHYGHAEYSGLMAGENMTGAAKSYALLSYLWSDVFDLHLEAAGEPEQAERFLRRGEDPASAILIGVADGKVCCYMALNRPDGEFGPLQIFIKKGITVAGKEAQLADPSVPFVQLLKG
jgi:NADPH-dependent 2,4-dienoyl-CoA reductase/sulfur reductase-like enzyme